MIRAFVLGSLLLASALTGADTIYQSTDKNGNPVFTDQPQPNAKAVELPSTNTTPGMQPPTAPTAAPSSAGFSGYRTVQLSVPSSIPNGLAPTTIGIQLEPSLQSGHRWQFLIDGQLQEEGTGASFTIERLERGPHQFELNVFDERGAVVGETSTEVFVYWPGKSR